MMRYAALIALVALSLQASARHILPEERALYRRSIKDNDLDTSDDIEVKTPWSGHTDKGYPEFDGNPFKEPLVSLAAGLADLAHDYLKDKNDFPLIIEEILKSGVKAPWHSHADKGYPEFDGNPAKQSLVEITTWLSSVARDAVKNDKDVPLIIKQFLKSAQKTNWDSFDEYLDFWKTALKIMKSYYDRFSNNVDNDSNDE